MLHLLDENPSITGRTELNPKKSYRMHSFWELNFHITFHGGPHFFEEP